MICEVWDELLRYLQSIAPAYVQQIMKPPATDRTIRDLEENLAIALPSDYREFLKIHNGNRSGKRFFAFSLFGVDQIASETSKARQELINLNRGFMEGGWDGQKILIGDNQVGWALAIDCDSGAPYVYYRGSYAIPLAASFLEYLVGLRDNLQRGKFEVIGDDIFMNQWGQRSD
jgi:cell wall assembly regulator SMI1